VRLFALNDSRRARSPSQSKRLLLASEDNPESPTKTRFYCAV
jgi:hypothetical protein